MPHARRVTEPIAPMVESARTVGDPQMGRRARRERDGLGDARRGGRVLRGNGVAQLEREVFIRRVRRRELEVHVERLRDGRRVFDGVIRVEIHHVGAVAQQPFFLRLVGQGNGHVAGGGRQAFLAVGAGGRRVIHDRVRLVHSRSPFPGHLRAETAGAFAQALGEVETEDKPPGGGRAEDGGDGKQAFDGHKWVGRIFRG